LKDKIVQYQNKDQDKDRQISAAIKQNESLNLNLAAI